MTALQAQHINPYVRTLRIMIKLPSTHKLCCMNQKLFNIYTCQRFILFADL